MNQDWGQFVFLDDDEQSHQIDCRINKTNSWETIEEPDEEYDTPSIFETLYAIDIRTTFLCTVYLCIFNASIYLMNFQSRR